ncbi:acyltransferase family protein [Carboxylicivirga sp. RSCT41]|uniref:acyltransferase family protein n=1 Tax=Carboxylicivirga agarovorans TaxID=3417570 RepID=UPI003D32AED9
MEKQVTTQKERLYYIDWLRIILIVSVFLFHIGMVFNSWDWHIKNEVTFAHKSTLWYIMEYLGQWRMPLLVLVSGAGTFLALGTRSVKQYLSERFKRLFIPLTAGIFVLVPVQVYLERAGQYSSLMDYYPHMFDGIYPVGNFSWHHLWFIAYLFFIALVVSPFLKYMRSSRFKNRIESITPLIAKRFGANIFLVPIVISQLILRPYFPDNTHDLINDWAAMAYYILYFLSGYIIVSNARLMESIEQQRRIYLVESILAAVIMFVIPYQMGSEALGRLVWRLASCTLAWTCGLAALGYARRYLNYNTPFRKIANEAIYPFYLIHQPVIVLFAYYIVSWDIALIWKAIAITVLSFSSTIILYWCVVRPFNLMRILFGMKPKSKAPSFELSNRELKLKAQKVRGL